MIGRVRRAGDHPGVRPRGTVVHGRHQVDGGFLAVEFLPDHRGAVGAGENIGPRRPPIGPPDRQRLREGAAAVARARIEQTLADLATRVPGHMIGARARNRQARTVMRASGDLPVVFTHAMQFAGRCGIREGDDRMIANATLEDIPENDDGAAGPRERQRKATALAGVVLGQPGFRVGRAAIGR